MNNLEQKTGFMPNLPSMPNLESTPDSTLGIQNQTIIIVLIVLLGLSFLGINILTISGGIVEGTISIFGPMFAQILSIFGYTTGSVINKTADVVGDVAKTGVDVAEGSLQSVGTILKDASRRNVNPATASSLDNVLNVGPNRYSEPHPDSTTNPIQNPITSGKAGWCLVGEYEGRRGCISVGESDRCMSGQIYPSQAACTNVAPATFEGGIPNPR
jgi:hypothetical protein